MSYTAFPVPSLLVGATPVQMQAWLVAAQAAYAELSTGAKVASASYGTGDGSRSVSYTQANRNDLRAWIAQLQRGLGLNVRVPPRRIGIRF